MASRIGRRDRRLMARARACGRVWDSALTADVAWVSPWTASPSAAASCSTRGQAQGLLARQHRIRQPGFTRDSGPLRVIPGSHRRSEPPIDMEHGYATGMGPHPDEVKIIAPAGSVILFNSADLWHSGTFNYTPAARLALTAHFAPGHRLLACAAAPCAASASAAVRGRDEAPAGTARCGSP
jgi:hypothetical protein